MSFPQVYWAYFLSEIVVVGLLWLFSKDEARRRWGFVLVGSMTVLVVAFISLAMIGNRMMKTNTAVSTDQAELQLRLYSCVTAVENSTLSGLAQMMHEKAPIEKRNLPKEQAYKSAEKSLRAAVQQAPKSRTYKAKLAILLATDNRQQNKAEIAQLVQQLAATPGSKPDDESFRSLGITLKDIYIAQSVPADQISAHKNAIETALPSGWFRENALTALYQTAHAGHLLEAHQKAVEARYMATFGKLVFMMGTMLLCGLIGVIVIFVQLAFLGRAKTQAPPDAVGLPVPARLIYCVFISWFTIQIVMSLGFHALSDHFAVLSTRAELVALSTAITYLLSNLPGPFLIYYLALKPAGLPFWKALRIQLKTSSSGGLKLFALGWLAWCAAIPLIIGAAAIASKLMGTQGSDNPVIGQIVQAAGASSVQATLLFYFTLGVMAPFFEEILFRGFVYAALKQRIGSAFSILASALLFAIMHFDRGGILMLFAIGLVLAYTFEKTRSLVPSMIAHGLWNSGSFTLALVLFGT